MRNHDARFVLLYAGACPKCRAVSRILIALSLGTMRRVPMEREEAHAFYDARPEARGRPALVAGEELTYGWPVVLAVPRLLARVWMQRIRNLAGAMR
jgi:predicted DCC family thiol-disulfide oxidoreductase YuxK